MTRDPRNRPPAAGGLERLWAPWRMTYIRRASSVARDARTGEECLFCRMAGSRADRRDLVLARGPEALLMLNRYPYNPGHLMVAIRRHAAQFRDLTPAELTGLGSLVALAEHALATEYHPDGLNYGLNVGRVAGAGVPGHLHLHLVPRWNGDTNFMTAVAGTRVLPESLDRTWQRLARVIATLQPRRTRGAAR